MSTPARVLDGGDVRRLLGQVRRHRHAQRDSVMILLSFKAGLRACEIAGLGWSMVLKPNGRLAAQLAITGGIAKNGRSRMIPMNAELAVALERLHRGVGRVREGAVVASERGGHMTPRSVVNWFHGLYEALGLDGCSSHSGRRTFITRSARLIAKSGGSLRDVQELAGHRALTTTERYIEGDRDAQRRLVALV